MSSGRYESPLSVASGRAKWHRALNVTNGRAAPIIRKLGTTVDETQISATGPKRGPIRKICKNKQLGLNVYYDFD